MEKKKNFSNIEKEIELMNSSKDVDMFDYGNSVNMTISISSIFIAVLVGLIIEGFEKNIFWIFVVFIIDILFVIFMYKIRLNPISIIFKKKYNLIRKRYSQILDLDSLDKELRETK